jgi:uncharacterized protein YdeI (YjbR/CyaY-like superfamily)
MGVPRDAFLFLLGTRTLFSVKPRFFASQNDFRQWLQANHDTADELVVGFWKVDSGKPSMTWLQSVDEALCFGWIDGVRRRIDSESYSIRFTPRRPQSIWSSINISKVEELKKKGLMHSAGIAAYERRAEERSVIYSYENRPRVFDAEYEQQFKSNEKAWAFFESLPPGYRRQMIYWVVSAKQEVTRIKRLKKLIEACEAGRRL